MSIVCGQTDFSTKHIKRLEEIGQFVHCGLDPFVFDDGVVRTSEAENEEVIYVQQEARSATGSRKGQRTRSRPRPQSGRKQFRSSDLEAAFGDQFRILVSHYRAVGFEDPFGLWLAIRTRPLGSDGPTASILVATPSDQALMPKAWAFNSVGTQVRPFPLKHTNFPDASICAFNPREGRWTPEKGLLALIDHYTLWVLKSWHRVTFGWWPGPQVGHLPYYRRREFVEAEWCGCGSKVPYVACHQYRDTLISDSAGSEQFRRHFGCDYSDRALPHSIFRAASTVWRELPSMRLLYYPQT